MKVKEREYFQRRFRRRRRPGILRSLMAERREKPFNIFQKVEIRKTRYEYIREKSTFWKLRIFLHLLHHETLLNQVVKPLGMKVIIFP